jgi:uncharacterized protein HemY
MAMRIVNSDPTEVTLTLTRDELRILANSMNEANEALDDLEFSTRMGAERKEVLRLHAQIHALLTMDTR